MASSTELWERFIELLNEKDALRFGKQVMPHVSFMGSIASYKKIFLEANEDDDMLVVRITTAYEQGVGHALRDELSNPYEEGSQEAEAWNEGREFGRERYGPGSAGRKDESSS